MTVIPQNPSSYPNRSLLLVAGTTPQILTETLFSLTQLKQQPFIPTEIDVLTTQDGKDKLISNLLADDIGMFHRLLKHKNLPPILFNEDRIHVIPDQSGQALSDIRTRAENQAAADFIIEWVRNLTQDQDRAVHASLAGGRKTMGYYLGYALSLFGRPQDRLSHVLVDPRFESRYDFFFPHPDNKAPDSAIDLAEIHFVSLRNQLPASLKGLEQGTWSFSATVTALQETLNPQTLTLRYLQREVQIGQHPAIHLSPVSMAFYGMFARATLQGEALYAPTQHTASPELYQRFMHEADRTEARQQTGRGIVHTGMTKTYWYERKSKLREELISGLGPLALAYDIDATTPGKPAGYGLKLPRDLIHIEDH